MILSSLSSLKTYFKTELQSDFSPSEIKLIFNQIIEEKLGIRDAYYLFEEIEISTESKDFFIHFIKELKSGKPFQQLLGYTEFCGLKIKLSPDVLIPRPETAELVDLIKNEYKNRKTEVLKVIDVCSGSGCISLSLKSNFENFYISGLEKSTGALSISRENSELLKLKVDFIERDILQEDWGFVEDSIDIIVSNPPYILNSERAMMSKTVLDYEPEMALFVDDEKPIIFYQHIAIISKQLLKKGGKLYFEINENYGKEVVDFLSKLGYLQIQIHKDLQGKDRMIAAKKG